MLDKQSTKSNLAKLLATENIDVQYQKVDTASFNVGTRVLTLPIIDDMTDDMQDLFIGHEVGHALFTPKEYGDVQEGMPRGFGTFLNVVEDARIERDIKNQYPGLKRSFAKGYGDFMRQDFFKVRGKDLDNMLLIDRINMHFKIGSFCNIDFNEKELQLRDKVENCQSFDDVVRVSKELFEYCKQEMEEKKEQDRQEYASDDPDYDDYSDLYDDDSSQDGDDGLMQPTESQSSRMNSDSSEFEILSPEMEAYEGEVKSVTDEKLQESLRKLASTERSVRVGNLPESNCVNLDELIVPYKNIVDKVFAVSKDDLIRFMSSDEEPVVHDLFSEFERKNKNAIAYLVKEFELRKKAAENRRIVVSDTGVLDTNKLHTYKFNDDIFRKIGSIPSGKNHGVVMFLDWSGSMSDNMSGTIEQVLTLVSFCQKIKVPYEVYAFSTEYRKHTPIEIRKPTIKVSNKLDMTIAIESGFNLLNLFSSKMKNTEYRKMANTLLIYGKLCGTYWGSSAINHAINHSFRLGGTPLNSTIFVASEIVKQFRKTYRAEIVNTIFLTDGDDSTSLSMFNTYLQISEKSYNSTSYINDLETKRRYKVGSMGVTPVLLQILKDRTGCNLLGFYVLSKTKRDFGFAFSRFGVDGSLDESYTNFKQNKFFAVSNYGYDEYFLIPGGNSLKIDDEGLDDLLGENNTNVSARKLRGAFLKMNQSRLTNRVLLSKVIEKVA